MDFFKTLADFNDEHLKETQKQLKIIASEVLIKGTPFEPLSEYHLKRCENDVMFDELEEYANKRIIEFSESGKSNEEVGAYRHWLTIILQSIRLDFP